DSMSRGRFEQHYGQRSIAGAKDHVFLTDGRVNGTTNYIAQKLEVLTLCR
ncbi:5079_t:CDS:2, partial [Funneliformis mosseae]